MDERYELQEISNYYGGIWIGRKGEKFYWLIENWDTNFDNIGEWSEIPEPLYRQLYARL